MPCICYGAKSGKEEYDDFIASDKGQEVMQNMSRCASIIMSHNIDRECDLNDIEFRQMFAKCFLHMMIGCDEENE